MQQLKMPPKSKSTPNEKLISHFLSNMQIIGDIIQ